MQILARAVGRRKEAVAQIQISLGTGKFLINNKSAEEYLQPVSQKYIGVKSPFEIIETNLLSINLSDFNLEKITLNTIDTTVKVKGGGLSGQSDAIKLGIARAFCKLVELNLKKSNEIQNNDILDSNENRNLNEQNAILQQNVKKYLKNKGYLTQDSRIKERRKYGLKKARKASQYHKR